MTHLRASRPSPYRGNRRKRAPWIGTRRRVMMDGKASSSSSAKATGLAMAVGLAGKAASSSSGKATVTMPHVSRVPATDVLGGRTGQAAWSVRYEVLDVPGNLVGELHPYEVGQITWDPSSRIQRILDGVALDPVESATLARGVSRIRPVFELPGVGYELALGTFTYFGGSKFTDDNGDWIDCVPLWDRTYQLEQQASMSVAADTLLSDAVVTIATAGRIPAGDIDVVASSVRLGSLPLAFPIGGSKTRMSLLRQIASLMGYIPPGFSQADRLVLRPVPVPEDEWPSFTYVDGATATHVRSTLVESNSVADRPNTYIVISAQPTSDTLVGVYRVPASFENSEASIGFPIVKTKTVDGFSSQAQVDVAARTWAQEDHAVVEITTWDTMLEPTHDQWDVCEFVGGRRALEFWHQFDLSTGRGKHKAKKVYVNA